MFLFGIGSLFGWTMFMVRVTITIFLGVLGYLYYNPALITNFILTMIKNKETGAFDIRLGSLSWTFNSLIFNDLCWMNPVICGFTSPYFARIGSFSVAVDIFQCLQALCDPTNHVIVVRSLEIMDVEIYIEKVAEENPGPSLNLWAALGSKDDHEATNVHSMMQQSIAKVNGGKGGKGGMFDNIGGLIKTAADAATPDRVEGVLHSALDMLTSEGDDDDVKANKTKAAEQPDQPNTVVQKKGLPYKVQLSHFAIKELTLHVPAYLGAAAPPIKLSGVNLSDLSNAAGASIEDLVMKVLQHSRNTTSVTTLSDFQLPIASYPLMTTSNSLYHYCTFVFFIDYWSNNTANNGQKSHVGNGGHCWWWDGGGNERCG